MGHYLSEMMCNTCGEYICRCKKVVEQRKIQWVVDDDFSVVNTVVFEKKNNKHGFGYYKTAMTKRYDTKVEAMDAAHSAIIFAIADGEEKVSRLKEKLNEYPWF